MPDESIDPVPPPEDFFETGPTPPLPPRPLSYWVGRVMVCNPFYLVSVVLLLFATYRISVDPHYFEAEAAQLTFNFASLQVYELMLVVTAIVLARRLIWNDATLLVVLEGLLVFVPFILVSQAALIDRHVVVVLSIVAAALAGLRWGSVRHWVPALPLTRRLTAIALLVFAANAALPVIYRTLHESKVGTKPTWGAAFDVNEYRWLLLLPVVLALVNVLPRLRGEDGRLVGERRWLPLAIFALWAAGTSVHLWALGYVYDFDLRRELVTPALWVLAWTFFRRLEDVVHKPAPEQRSLAITLPLLSTLPAVAVQGSHVFLVLTGLNLAAYAAVWLKNRGYRPALHMMLVTLSILTTVLPWERYVPRLAELEPPGWVFMTVLIYLFLCAILSRDPKIGVGGAIAVAIACGTSLGGREDATTWALQTGLVFLLLHSLRWVDREHAGAAVVRYVAALAWLGHSAGWAHEDQVIWPPVIIGLGVLVLCVALKLVCGFPLRLVVPVAAVLTALCAPVDYVLFRGRTAPLGLVALAASFIVFAIGTVATLTKHRWLKHGGSEAPKVGN